MSGITRPDAVVFDWDNTLVDSWLAIHDALSTTFAEMGTPAWTLAETKERTRESLRDAFPKLFGDRWQHAQKVFLDSFEATHLERIRPLDGAGDLLAALAATGCHMAVVSNKTGRLLRDEIVSLGWKDYFGGVVGAGDADFDKPHRAPVDLALADSGFQAGERVWFVGDTAIDMACALNAGCVPVLVHTSLEEELHSEFAAARPRHRFGDFAALARAVIPVRI